MQTFVDKVKVVLALASMATAVFSNAQVSHGPKPLHIIYDSRQPGLSSPKSRYAAVIPSQRYGLGWLKTDPRAPSRFSDVEAAIRRSMSRGLASAAAEKKRRVEIARARPDDPKALFGALLALQLFQGLRYEQGYWSVGSSDWQESRGAVWLLAATASKDPAVTRARLIFELEYVCLLQDRKLSAGLLALAEPWVKHHPADHTLVQTFALALASSLSPSDWSRGDEMIRRLAMENPRSLTIAMMPFSIKRFRYIHRKGSIENARAALAMVPALRRRLPPEGTLATEYLPFAIKGLEATMEMRGER